LIFSLLFRSPLLFFFFSQSSIPSQVYYSDICGCRSQSQRCW
jgi:hypothetical protein